MIKVAVMYPNGPENTFDMDYYLTKHMAMVHDRLDSICLVKTEVDKGLAGMGEDAPPPYMAIGYLYFENMEGLQKMLPYDPEFAGDVPNFTNVQPIIQISEIVG
ncbi:MAG: EthD family reductase [Dehalococcoidales bacterium]|nr:EthD family reductase [Dehalococcoidales bacterium]